MSIESVDFKKVETMKEMLDFCFEEFYRPFIAGHIAETDNKVICIRFVGGGHGGYAGLSHMKNQEIKKEVFEKDHDYYVVYTVEDDVAELIVISDIMSHMPEDQNGVGDQYTFNMIEETVQAKSLSAKQVNYYQKILIHPYEEKSITKLT